jgi:hypothetical protein
MSEFQAQLHSKLNGETGKLCWRELERHYARGVVVKVDAALDLVDVAVSLVQDDAATLGVWLEQGLVARVSDSDAGAWSTEPERLFWAVVVAPWVVIQVVAGEIEAAVGA